MSIPYTDATQQEAGGTAGFFRVVARGEHERRGALFQVNARGEPVELAFNRLDLPASGLWRPQDLERQARRVLAMSLFEAARRTPLVLVCLAGEVDPPLFQEELHLQIPVCRVADQGEAPAPGPAETAEGVHTQDRLAHVFWHPAPPGAASPSRRLIDALAARGLLFEPFQRLLRGLDEAFADGGG